jgi:hypothetical protein
MGTLALRCSRFSARARKTAPEAGALPGFLATSFILSSAFMA